MDDIEYIKYLYTVNLTQEDYHKLLINCINEKRNDRVILTILVRIKYKTDENLLFLCEKDRFNVILTAIKNRFLSLNEVDMLIKIIINYNNEIINDILILIEKHYFLLPKWQIYKIINFEKFLKYLIENNYHLYNNFNQLIELLKLLEYVKYDKSFIINNLLENNIFLFNQKYRLSKYSFKYYNEKINYFKEPISII